MNMKPLVAVVTLVLAASSGAGIAQSAPDDDTALPAPGEVLYQDGGTTVFSGDNALLDRIVADALQRYPGKVTDVDLDDDRYEIDIRQSMTRKVELEYSAHDGRLLKVEIDRFGF